MITTKQCTYHHRRRRRRCRSSGFSASRSPWSLARSPTCYIGPQDRSAALPPPRARGHWQRGRIKCGHLYNSTSIYNVSPQYHDPFSLLEIQMQTYKIHPSSYPLSCHLPPPPSIASVIYGWVLVQDVNEVQRREASEGARTFQHPVTFWLSTILRWHILYPICRDLWMPICINMRRLILMRIYF